MKRFLSVALFALVSIGGSAGAATLNVSNVGEWDYDFYTQIGTFNDLQAELETQPWWENGLVMQRFRRALGGDLGFPNYWCNAISTNTCGTGAPIFAYLELDLDRFLAQITSLRGFHQQGLRDDVEYTFALVTVNSFIPAVPLPATLPLLAVGLGGLGLIGQRRKKLAA
ncbi:MAG: VPLPA-CTERM sorting domain-containing protein [Roseobacter sp.]